MHMYTRDKGHLLRVVGMLRDFEEHFSLSLAQAKTRVWASNVKTHEELRDATGFQVKRSLQALGAEWPTNKGAKLTHKKELARLDQCISRLTRAGHLRW